MAASRRPLQGAAVLRYLTEFALFGAAFLAGFGYGESVLARLALPRRAATLARRLAHWRNARRR